MIIGRWVRGIAREALAQGVVIDMKANYKEPVDAALNDPTPAIIGESDIKEPYKLPFIFLAGVLIGAGMGLSVKKVVVIK